MSLGAWGMKAWILLEALPTSAGLDPRASIFFLSHNSNIFESRSLLALFAFVVVIISGVHFPILSMLAPATI